MSGEQVVKYGDYTLDGAIMSVRLKVEYTEFNCDIKLLISKDTPAEMNAASTLLETKLREPNKKLEMKAGGNIFFTKDPAANEATAIRATIVSSVSGQAGNEVEINISGMLSAIEAAGDYIANWQATITQAGRVSFVYQGVYTANDAQSAQTLFDNPTNGAEAKAKAILLSLFSTKVFRLVESGLTEPQQDTNQWIQFQLRYVEQILPASMENDSYDWTGLAITQSAKPIGKEVEGTSLNEKSPPEGSHFTAETWNITTEVVYTYNIAGNIVIKLDKMNYSQMVTLWKFTLLPKLEDFLSSYFLASSSNNIKLIEHNVVYDVPQSTIAINMSFLGLGSGGILEFSETVGYNFDPRNIIEYYLNDKDDFDAWKGKLPTKVTCTQTIRMTSLTMKVRPLAPKMPTQLMGIKTNLVWYSNGFNYAASPMKYPLNISRFGGFTVYTLNYTANYTLVKK